MSQMRIIIVGDGKVGYTIAERLSAEKHDVIIIDKNGDALRRAIENLDVMCIKGNGASPAVLEEAGVSSTDIVIAVTTNDEINMVCCLAAKKMGAAYTAARIRDPEYARDIRRLKQHLEINLVINPEQSTSVEILRLLRFPSADIIDVFAKGRAELIGFRANQEDPIIGVKLSVLRKKLGGLILVSMVVRDAEVHIPKGDFVIQPGDEVYILGGLLEITRFFKYLGRATSMVRDVLIVGGGRIAYYLAKDAATIGIKPTIIEIDPRICERLAEELPEAMVIHGDGTEQEVLESENISGADAFVTLTGRDEFNLMAALFAIQCKVRKVIAKANRQNYNQVVKELGIESVISPKEITANHILHFVRGIENSQGSSVETLYRLLDGRIEALEFIVKRDMKYIDTPIMDIPLKRDLLLGVITRRGNTIVPEGKDTLMEGDSVVIVTKRTGFSDIGDIFEH